MFTLVHNPENRGFGVILECKSPSKTHTIGLYAIILMMEVLAVKKNCDLKSIYDTILI